MITTVEVMKIEKISLRMNLNVEIQENKENDD